MKKANLEMISHEHALLRAALECIQGTMEECDAPAEALLREVRSERLLEAARALVRAADGGGPLTFAELREANVERCKNWHTSFLDPNDAWNLGDWANAMQGEAGELAEIIEILMLSNAIFKSAGNAGNTVKKIRRHDTGARQGNVARDGDRNYLVKKALKELGDTIIYGDLLAAKLGGALDAAITEAFNQVSARQGLPQRLRQAPVDFAPVEHYPSGTVHTVTINQKNTPPDFS